MILQIYKPNSKNTGCAVSFDIGNDKKTNEPLLFIKAIKQHSWDSKTKNGSFHQNAKDPQKSIGIRINEFEIGGILRHLERMEDWKTYHKYKDTTTSISLTSWVRGDGSKAHSLGLIRDSSNKFGIAIEQSEGRALVELLRFYLNLLFQYRLDEKEKYVKP